MTTYAVRDLRPMDHDAVYRYLSQEAYWSQGLPRVVTDHATFAWLCDVFVLPLHRGKGVSKLLMDAVMAHPHLQRVRNFMLATRDAHGLYAKYGFAPLAEPARWMAIRRPYRT